jgi:hypothetical protein
MGHPRLFTPRVLWAALLFSQVLYFVMLAAPGLLEVPSTPPAPVMLYGLAGAAVVVAVVSFALPAVLQRGAAARSRLDTKPLEGAAVASAAYRAEVGPRGFADREAALQLGIQLGLTPFILGCALNESVALFGFVLGFLGEPLLVVLPFFVASWLMMLPRFPTERGFLRPLARAHGIEP